MSTANEDGKQPEKMESPKQGAACCGPGCGCGTAAKPSKTRWVIGVVVLVAAGVMVVRAMIKSDGGATQTTAPTFAALAASPSPAGEGVTTTKSGAAAATTEQSLEPIGAISELNAKAAKLDAVFVFLPGKEGTSSNPAAATMNKATRTIESKASLKCGLFTLKPGSPDYDQIAAEMSVPGVLAMVKGRGMSPISGEITEAKLLQGFVAASSAGGCGPSASPGCCPK